MIFIFHETTNALDSVPVSRFVLFDLIFTSQSTIFQLCWDGSSWVEPVLSKD